jgi:hypothetical protein
LDWSAPLRSFFALALLVEALMEINVFIATGNITRFNALLLMERDSSSRRVLQELLDKEKGNLASALVANVDDGGSALAGGRPQPQAESTPAKKHA